ncbi:MAG: anaerobic ribonucleoside-triphosphate reductase activating protein [Candidatus Aenigmarchaeota archaeon]|nr:anaerobic ribonucleoside-triphosphate reductase activating protein [Candidatus Aenigmarchaeota archaeon]NIQ18047.1 anaerobic ribonucleoside-triphosphate reductase activating protein [Candidatus Aenigmarchaeota archaeon]
MLIGGLQKTSLIDYPDKVSCIVFTVGCNLRCPFCQNADLVIDTKETPIIAEKYFFNFLKSRKGLLDAVVITGGEPLLQKDIEGFIKKIRSMGFLVKLDTNGCFPVRLKKLIDDKLLDYIAMDIKSSPSRYEKACGVKVDIKKIRESVRIIMNSGVSYEFRTTAVPRLQKPRDFIKIGKWLEGARKYVIQKFSNEHTLDKKFGKESPYTQKEMEDIRKGLSKFFDKCEVRG